MSDTSEFQKYIDMVLKEEQDDVLHEIANLGSHNHGIPDVVIWAGKANKQHGLRIKVSNIKNRWSNENNFVIQLPQLDYDPSRVARWITTDTINKIMSWIKLNQQVLHDFETDESMYTDQFISQLSKVQ